MVLAALFAILFAQLDGPTGLSAVVPTRPIDFSQRPGPAFSPTFPSIDEVARSSIYSQPPTQSTYLPVPPNVALADSQSASVLGTSIAYNMGGYGEAGVETQATNAAYQFDPPQAIEQITESLGQVPYQPEFHVEGQTTSPSRWDGQRWRNLKSALGRRIGPDYGLGFERVMFAPMVLDTAISSPNAGLRIRADRGLASPDRLEYLWAKAGRGPAPETRIDLIDTVYRTELGNANAALISEISMRSLNPEVNPNTVGFGDMVIGGKALVYDGRCTKISTIFLSYLNTGPTKRGLGTGHVSLEPGMLLRHQWTDKTYLHSEIKYRLPIAGSAGFAGDVLTTGWGLSTIWRETDRYALMPTLEMQTHSFLFGAATRSNGVVERIDGITAIDMFPGMRCAYAKSAMGTWEVGLAGGVTFADRDWFDSRMVLDLRWIR